MPLEFFNQKEIINNQLYPINLSLKIKIWVSLPLKPSLRFHFTHFLLRNMTSCMDLLETSEQLCYVQCSFCTTILLVSVPCCSLLKMVTVRCGHCSGLLSVNMMRASFVPLHLLAPLKDDAEMQELCGDGSPSACDENYSLSTCFEDNEDQTAAAPTVNKPPEKRQRAPSAYNRFMKEEIQRLKKLQPGMTHKEAFTTAAKNWAHFPRIQYKGGESCNQGEGKLARSADAYEVDVQNKSFYDSRWTRTPVESTEHAVSK